MDDISEKMAARKRKKAESNKRAYARKKEAEAAKKKLQAAMDEHKPAPTTLKDMHEMYKAAKTDPNEPLKSSKPTGRPYNLAVERVPMDSNGLV